jgi:hypothetical protein
MTPSMAGADATMVIGREKIVSEGVVCEPTVAIVRSKELGSVMGRQPCGLRIPGIQGAPVGTGEKWATGPGEGKERETVFPTNPALLQVPPEAALFGTLDAITLDPGLR